MNILFDIGHPAHVHLFKNFIFYLKNNNQNVTTVSRAKDVTTTLLDYYGIDHKILSSHRGGFYGHFNELIIRDKKLIKLHHENRFSLAFGTSVSIAHLTFLKGIKSYNFHEDDDAVVPLQSILIYPFTSKIINPDCLKTRGWVKKRVFYPSYHELAYLHPNNFTPDPHIPGLYELDIGNYVIVRLSALNAHHDKKKKGISNIFYEKIRNILSGYDVIESAESSQTHNFKPWHMHDLIAHAKLVISDSQTTTAEAAVLGVPSIRCNSFVGSISYLEELENKYELTYGFKPNDEDAIINKINQLLSDITMLDKWKKRREIMLSEKIDFNDWMINYFNSLK